MWGTERAGAGRERGAQVRQGLGTSTDCWEVQGHEMLHPLFVLVYKVVKAD